MKSNEAKRALRNVNARGLPQSGHASWRCLVSTTKLPTITRKGKLWIPLTGQVIVDPYLGSGWNNRWI